MLYVAEERTAGGRLFHALGPAFPATANARSPIVDRRVAGTYWYSDGDLCDRTLDMITMTSSIS